MAKKIDFTNLPIDVLKELIASNDFMMVRKAKLIPTYKIGDEMALTSVFLSSLKLIKEFRKIMSENMDLSRSGKIHIFTEVTFKEFDNKRIDGMILIEKGNKIIDSALFEMKNGSNELELNQINSYIEIADAYKIPKLITISNQFVSHPTQSPLDLKKKRQVAIFHFSWTYILTIAHILLADNDTNIEDPDQVEIMREVVDYFEYDKSGICGFKSMKEGWKKTTEKINKQESLKKDDPDVLEAVQSWLQEEKDMALKLSQELGILVESGVKKYREDLRGRITEEVKKIIATNSLKSILNVKNAPSSITVSAYFARKNIEFSTSFTAPQDKSTIKGQMGWIRNQLNKMQSKNPVEFDQYKSDILIEVAIKNTNNVERIPIAELEAFMEKNKEKFLKEYGFVLVCPLGSNFSSKTKCITIIETTLIDYYKTVVQHITKWVKPVPEIKNKEQTKVLD